MTRAGSIPTLGPCRTLPGQMTRMTCSSPTTSGCRLPTSADETTARPDTRVTSWIAWRIARKGQRRNLSAVLQGLGDTWLPGYLPAYNVQASLEDAVARWLAYNPDWLDSVPALATADAVPLRVEPPPTLANHPLPEGHERMSGIAVRFDAAGRDERNRALGRLGERLALAHERTVLERAGRT